MANKPTEQELRQQKTAEAVSKTELFFQKNAKLIYGCVAAVLVIALAILAYNRFIYQPKKAEAQKEMFKAEQKFAAGDFELALNGDDNNMGFEEIISTYGKKAGEAVYLYAGGSALQLGDSMPVAAPSSWATSRRPSSISRSTPVRTRSSSPAPRPASVTPMWVSRTTRMPSPPMRRPPRPRTTCSPPVTS